MPIQRSDATALQNALPGIETPPASAQSATATATTATTTSNVLDGCAVNELGKDGGCFYNLYLNRAATRGGRRFEFVEILYWHARSIQNGRRGP